MRLKPAIDAFFTAVMVNAEDPAVRSNRLSLLQEVDDFFNSFADFSQIVVQGRLETGGEVSPPYSRNRPGSRPRVGDLIAEPPSSETNGRMWVWINHCQTISVGRGKSVGSPSACLLLLIVLCNAIVLVGLWASGINLDELATTSGCIQLQTGYLSPARLAVRCGGGRTGSSLFGVDQSFRSVRQDSSASTGHQASARAGRAVLCGSGIVMPTIGCSYWCCLSWQSLRSGWRRNGIWSAGIGCVSNPPPATGISRPLN